MTTADGSSTQGGATGGDPTGVDVAAVTDWFRANVPAAEPPLSFSRVAGGHSCLTFVVTDATGQKFVLRRPPLGHVLATAHDVLREHRIMSALQDTGMPVPTMLGACADNSVNDAPFYVMGHVEGAVLHDAEDARRSLPDEATRRHASESMVDALVTLHAIDPDDVGIGDLSRRSGYLDRQLRRWSSQWEASKTRELPGMERLHQWLVDNRPADLAGGIVHGDFRLGNTLLSPDGTVLAVLDWELCTLGDPMADVSYLLRSWTQPDEPAGPRAEPPTRIGGFLTREEMAQRYAERSGRDLGDLGYWMAFNAWRSAAIAEGVYRRYLDGAMGQQPEDLDQYKLGVEASVEAGLASAGLS
jgi:aminoglycoside phosphotransferase (APT) family kinase protein